MQTAALLLPLGAFAQTLTDIDALSPEDRRAYFQAMSDEERAAKREQLHKEWEALPDEQKQAMREKRNAARDERRAAQREKWQSMSDEERQAAREKSRAKHAERAGNTRSARWQTARRQVTERTRHGLAESLVDLPCANRQLPINCRFVVRRVHGIE